MDKYYTPTIEEFHIGFEYEFRKENEDWYNNESDEVICDFKNDAPIVLREDIKNKRVRVKYLDREDIESLGWEPTVFCNYTMAKELAFQKQLKINYWIYLQTIDNITTIWTSHLFKNLFHGQIKNKSELKKLMQQLNLQ